MEITTKTNVLLPEGIIADDVVAIKLILDGYRAVAVLTNGDEVEVHFEVPELTDVQVIWEK